MLRIIIALLMVTLVADLARAQAQEPPPDPPEPAFVLTLEWTDAGVSIKTKDKREAVIPEQKGMPLLRTFFFVLEDVDKNVHYAGGLVDPRAMYAHGEQVKVATSTLVIPNIEEAHHLVIYERRSLELDGRHQVLEEQLQ